MCKVSEESVSVFVMAVWFLVLIFHSLVSPVGHLQGVQFSLLSLESVHILRLSLFFFWTTYFVGVYFVKRIL